MIRSDLSLTVVTSNTEPTDDYLQAISSGEWKLACVYNPEGGTLSFLKILRGSPAPHAPAKFEVTSEALLHIVYEFFVAGWNSGEQYLKDYRMTNIRALTVEQLRKSIVSESQSVMISHLKGTIRANQIDPLRQGTYFVSEKDMKVYMLSAFQYGFRASAH